MREVILFRSDILYMEEEVSVYNIWNIHKLSNVHKRNMMKLYLMIAYWHEYKMKTTFAFPTLDTNDVVDLNYRSKPSLQVSTAVP